MWAAGSCHGKHSHIHSQSMRNNKNQGDLNYCFAPSKCTKPRSTSSPSWTHRQLNSTLFLSKAVQKERPLGAVRGRSFLPFLARSTRPSLWASCRREPPWDEIWMRTFASGRSNDVSPTYRNEAAVCLGRFLYIRRKGRGGSTDLKFK